ncbi:MAG: hypothetical protein C4B58_10125 [Deltaproteobacteria bacterium]|nr:MAG: hypothetical protein C4B58_10125 [Deltaproteobacteria bacterium]
MISIRIKGLSTDKRFVGFVGFIADGEKLFLCELCERYSFSLARSFQSLEAAETAERKKKD